jgi:DNA-directed RNA polymerase subunit RPC12/RpoP
MPYLQQFACFQCRKTFKYEIQHSHWRVKNHPSKARQADNVVCPDCGETMWLMGRKFKAPKRSNLKQWLKVEKIRKAGFRRFPKYLWQVDNVIERFNEKQNPPSEGEKLLKKFKGNRGEN